jgi:hypothetical protein
MTHCYLCAARIGADGVAVCGGCARQQLGPTVRATGEFIVPALGDVPADAPPSAGPAAPAPSACSWCDRPAAAVQKLLGNHRVAICNECVALCADVLDAELGPTWRS